MIENSPVSLPVSPFACQMWIQPLSLTLQLILVSGAIAAVVGIITAWAASSLEAAGGIGRWMATLLRATMVASIAMPLILHAAAWESTAGKFGWLPLTQTGSRSSGFTAYGAFGGLTACGMIHGLFGAALVSLATWHGVRTVPPQMVDQAELDQSAATGWWWIRLPLAMPWLVAALLVTTAIAATEMTVADLYGFRTIADQFYLFFAVAPTSTSLMMTCVTPIAVGALLFVTITSTRRERISVRRDEVVVTSGSSRTRPMTFVGAAVVATLVTSFVFFVPIAGLFVKVGHQVNVEGEQITTRWSPEQTISTLAAAPSDFASEYSWTVLLSIATGFVAMAIAWPLAACSRSDDRIRRWADMVSIAAFMIPGPVVGLSVVKLFQSGLPGSDVLYQRTLIPTIIALSFRAAPIAYWVLRAGYRNLDQSLVDAARLDGNVWYRVWSIDRRMLRSSLFVAFTGASLMASGDVPATLPVIPPGVTTVGTRLFGLLHSGARQEEAALAIWYVGFVVSFATIGLSATRMRPMRSR